MTSINSDSIILKNYQIIQILKSRCVNTHIKKKKKKPLCFRRGIVADGRQLTRDLVFDLLGFTPFKSFPLLINIYKIMPQHHIYYKVCRLSTIQRAKTEIADYKYAAVGGTQKRQESEKMVSEKD